MILEEYIRGQVGAPSLEEIEMCSCGLLLTECDNTYEHLSKGS